MTEKCGVDEHVFVTGVYITYFCCVLLKLTRQIPSYSLVTTQSVPFHSYSGALVLQKCIYFLIYELLKQTVFFSVNEIALEATTVPPTQQQGVLRTEEMKTLYGRSAHDIESLETSLQLHFNMNVDMRHPVFWPSIPLRF